MSDIERLSEAMQRLDNLRRSNRPNQRRVHNLRQNSEARDVTISSRATTAPRARGSSLTPTNESQWIREGRIVREVVYYRTQKLLRKELATMQRDLLASEKRQRLTGQVEMHESDAAANGEPGSPPGDRESLGSDTGQDTRIKSLEWYFRKAFVDASLRPTQKPLKEIDPCFCSDPYAIGTADGECHEAVKMPRCAHVFGRSCIAMWLQEKDTCPMCRHKIVIISLE